MDRLIVPRKISGRAEAASSEEYDKALDRLIKYIPIEVISGYMLLGGLLDGANPASNLKLPAGWGLFWLGVILTPCYLWKIGSPTGVRWWHLPISTVAFILWAYALGGPFRTTEVIRGYPYESWFAAFLAGAFSWAIAVVWNPTETTKR